MACDGWAATDLMSFPAERQADGSVFAVMEVQDS
jgi:hypothetical protein